MRIIQLIYALGPGGAEKFVVNLSNELSNAGHDVTVCILRTDQIPRRTYLKKELTPAIKFHSCQLEPGFSLKKTKTVADFILSEKPDIVHCHLNTIPYIYKVALFHKEIRFIHTIHSIAEHASGGKFQRHINKFFYKTRRIVPVTISKICLQSFEQFYHLNDIVRIDNGCPIPKKTSRFNDVKKEIDSYRTDSDTKAFLHVARCAPPKNQTLLIESFNRLNSNGINFALLCIGNDFDSAKGKELQKLACSKIHFLGAKDNVGDYLHNADAFCLSSSFEGLPISLIEAMACGITPICTAVGGIPDVVTDGETGYLCPTLSVNDYVDCIHRYLQNPLSKATIESAFKNSFSMEKCANKYLEIYTQGK